MCRPRLAALHAQGRARGQGSNVEMHLDGTESGLWGHHGVSAPFWSQSRGREEGNLHPKAVPAMLRAFRISLWPWEKLGRGRAAAGRRLAVFNAFRLTSCQFTFALANPILSYTSQGLQAAFCLPSKGISPLLSHNVLCSSLFPKHWKGCFTRSTQRS